MPLEGPVCAMMCGVDDGNIAEICGKLRQDALHNLSLGGKELFHSDFLAWFAQSYPEEAAHVFSGYSPRGNPGPGEVARAPACSGVTPFCVTCD
jgi:hypothetical protein